MCSMLRFQSNLRSYCRFSQCQATALGRLLLSLPWLRMGTVVSIAGSSAMLDISVVGQIAVPPVFGLQSLQVRWLFQRENQR